MVQEGGAGRDGTEPIGWRDVGALCRSGDEDLFEALPEGVLKKEEKTFFLKKRRRLFERREQETCFVLKEERFPVVKTRGDFFCKEEAFFSPLLLSMPTSRASRHASLSSGERDPPPSRERDPPPERDPPAGRTRIGMFQRSQ